MALGEKQREVVEYLKTVDSATLSEIYENGVTRHYYYHARHLSPVMTRLVRAGWVVRIAHGRYKLRSQAPTTNTETRTLF